MCQPPAFGAVSCEQSLLRPGASNHSFLEGTVPVSISLWITRTATSTMLRSKDANVFPSVEKGDSARAVTAPETAARIESPFAHRHYATGLGRLSRRLSAGAHAAAICDMDPSACL